MNLESVYLGLGANIGDPVAQLRRALAEMLRRNLLLEPVRKSSLYRTPPWGGDTDQPWFINAAVGGKTSLLPRQLLAGLKAIERDLGRQDEGAQWGPRSIDLDILLYGTKVLKSPDLTIPHPRLVERAFALLPLVEIAPDLTDPHTGLCYAHHLAALADDAQAIARIVDVF